MEITIGKLRTVISTLLLFALAAIPESNVNEAENPHETSSTVRRNTQLLPTGFEIKRTNSKNPKKDKIEHTRKL